MYRLVAAAMLLLAVFVPSLAAAAPGGPTESLRSDQRPCVTEREFNRLYMHWNERQVQRWFDVAGQELKGKSRDGRWAIMYPVCGFDSMTCDGQDNTAGAALVVFDKISAVRAELDMVYDCGTLYGQRTTQARS